MGFCTTSPAPRSIKPSTTARVSAPLATGASSRIWRPSARAPILSEPKILAGIRRDVRRRHFYNGSERQVPLLFADSDCRTALEHAVLVLLGVRVVSRVE